MSTPAADGGGTDAHCAVDAVRSDLSRILPCFIESPRALVSALSRLGEQPGRNVSERFFHAMGVNDRIVYVLTILAVLLAAALVLTRGRPEGAPTEGDGVYE